MPGTRAATPAAALPHAGEGLTELARGQWPAGPADTLPGLPGFIVSSFSPLAAAAADRCLAAFFGSAPAPSEQATRTGVVLASATGDIATAAAVAAAVDAGRRVPPMLFYHSNPNAVVGFITARWGLAGPVTCTCPDGDVLADALRSGELLAAEGDADAVLVIAVHQAHPGDPGDRSQAVLLGPPSWLAAAPTAQRRGS
jgi:3-oxoacyl-(acyl-carrier-protein) synthase